MKNFFASGMILFLMLLIFYQMYFYIKNEIRFNDSKWKSGTPTFLTEA